MHELKTSKPAESAVRSGGIVVWLRRKCCRHEFRLGDQQSTGIQEQGRPAENASWAEWIKWYQGRHEDTAHTKRISWPCAKCGEVFYAHCGLDILAKRGKIMPHNDKIKPQPINPCLCLRTPNELTRP